MIAARGAMNIQSKKRTAETRAVRPVLPPASTPEADSTNVVTVDVPVREPEIVPTASDMRASFMFGMLPSLSIILARDAVPTSVPIVSNISMMQNVTISVTIVNQPMLAKPAKSSLKRVVLARSAKGGTNDAVFRLSKGLVLKKIASPAQ